MGKRGTDVDFVCPYYQWSRGVRVGCEGECRVSFPDRKSFDRYVGAYCANLPGWEGCTLARARTEYYEQTL